ncbi:TonB-dependent receptor [Neptunicella marina]|uniref:TonB-dependent receptor n=1 Tax=Neptunicella marina TaxID=2125989 RepID=A0A8J6IJK0_9ALTE|nr:TonB-dependent receptor [Neptunicella marina]MBC3764395.1 TonB-dependent receptor [Neptunicella marina]
MKTLKKASLALCIHAAMLAPVTFAQEQNNNEKQSGLEQITVTAQKRTQTLQEVPISIATLNGERFNAIFSGGDDVLALATRIPGLYAESSNGRVAPRFYMRGLGNTDFDLAASQPVSVVMDDVVMENVVLKSFPLFDVANVEVIRGPQGTLFGRNTTAGIVKFDTVRPSQTFDAFIKAGYGSYGTVNIEGAVGGALSDTVSARLSVLSQDRDDYIDNGYTGEKDAMGGFDEKAARLQVLFEPSENFSALLNVHDRTLDGTASIFRANILTKGSNDINQNYDRDVVYYDKGDNNPQGYDNTGASLKLDYDFADLTLTSITAFEKADGHSLGDIDGGVYTYNVDMPVPNGLTSDNFVDAGGPVLTFPGTIGFDAVTEDQLKDLEQFTQEIRLASDTKDGINWQVGAFYFDSSFDVTSIDGFFGATTVSHSNTTWAVFGQSSYDVSDKLNISAGIRYTHDKKSLDVGEQNVDGFALVIGAASVQDYDPINVSDGKVSWDLSANYRVTSDTSVFARLARGFRAQTIQGRDVAFESAPSVADSETIDSVEAGIKSDLINNKLRVNAAAFYYQVDNMQFSAIGGVDNLTQLVNADKGVGFGFETDLEWVATDYLTITAGYSYNHTEIQDDNLKVAPCGSGMCSPLDKMENGLAYVDGNPFPQAPRSTLSVTARYTVPVGNDGEFFAYTDWAWQGKTNLFLYESYEFRTDGNYEGGLRIGYENFADGYEVALFGRNITDEDNLKGAIDFNNLTGIVNEPRIVGIEFKKSFY